ncbi:heat shock protein HspQ [Candidatus Rariloculus sp.]|uniref:heat shock protein HspQ n=1 Tax=Candidatus Rariloculus sp. TaxID=3101265 RepID=UPI003D09671F
MSELNGCFDIGQIVEHRLFGYRGVVYDVDPSFMMSEEWYERVALSRPSKDQPWYHVLVDGAEHTTYVAERNLSTSENDSSPIRHPLIDVHLSEFDGTRYRARNRRN